MRRVAVGSVNPVKVAAVRNVIGRIWPEADVVALDAPSGVSDQPRTDEEAWQGAENRARQARDATGADLGIGLEGSTVDTVRGMFLSGWVAAVGRGGKTGLGCGGRVPLPDRVAARVREGMELGPVMDAFTGQSDTKKKQGAVGVFTGGLIDRTRAFEIPVIYALAPFITPENYGHDGGGGETS